MLLDVHKPFLSTFDQNIAFSWHISARLPLMRYHCRIHSGFKCEDSSETEEVFDRLIFLEDNIDFFGAKNREIGFGYHQICQFPTLEVETSCRTTRFHRVHSLCSKVCRNAIVSVGDV